MLLFLFFEIMIMNAFRTGFNISLSLSLSLSLTHTHTHTHVMPVEDSVENPIVIRNVVLVCGFSAVRS
jgi:hypothetical protein